VSTCIIYIDEAGSPYGHHIPLENGETPIFTLAALAFPLWEWRARDRAYLALKRQFFPDLLGKLDKRDEEYEIKGRDIAAPRFADSRLTVGLQLVDIFASNLFANQYHYYLRNVVGGIDYSHMQEYWNAVNKLQYKSRQAIDGYQVFGYRVIDQRPKETG
jgi:hypothetical protein